MNGFILPTQLPAIVLPRCTLLPHGLIPLHIFEDRYRKMLRYSLERERMFCVVMQRGTGTPDAGDDNRQGTAMVATAGLVRACVRNPDGSSNLLLQGIQRARLIRWIEPSVFPLAEVEWLPTTTRKPETCIKISAGLVDLACHLAEIHGNLCTQLRDYLRGMPDPETITDIVAYNFIRCPERLQQLVECRILDDRIALVKAELDKLAG